MPWTTPTLRETRELVRDYIAAGLPGADASIPNSVLRVMADSNAALAHLTLLYVDWLAKQIMVDTAEREWLDRFGTIWVGGRKAASFAAGSALFTGTEGVPIPLGTRLSATAGGAVEYETTEAGVLGALATEIAIRAIDPGAAGNQVSSASLSLSVAVAGVDSAATVVALTGGIEVESDDSLRDRVLTRIRKPPHGGADFDYVGWARDYPGVTRAWAKKELGMGTVTLRFMMDDDRPPYGLPTADDTKAVFDYIDPLRPVTVRDLSVVAPIAFPLVVTISKLSKDSVSTRAAISAALTKMLLRRAAPGAAIWRSWVDEAVSAAAGEDRHELTFTTTNMPTAGHIPVLGSVIYLP